MTECRHGLEEEWCSLCKRPTPPSPENAQVEATFAAKFDGDCPGCDLPIYVGQTIHKLSSGRYVHQGCE